MHSVEGLSYKELIRRTWIEFKRDGILDQSAKLSFYFLLSIFPLLLFLFALLGLLVKSGPQLQNILYEYLSAVVPQSASDLVNSTLGEVTASSSGGKVSIGLVFTLWAASQGMLAVMEGLNIAYNVEETRSWVRKHVIAIVLTIVCCGLIAIAIMVLMQWEHLSDYVSNFYNGKRYVGWLFHLLELCFLLMVVLIAFNILYIFAPNIKRRKWHWFMPGTLVGMGIWLAASFGFKLYLVFFNTYTLTYGSIGAVMILLMWFYLSGISILVGAEVNSEIEKVMETALDKGF